MEGNLSAPTQAAPQAGSELNPAQSQTQDATGAQTQPATASTVKDAAQEVMRKYKVKIAGEEREVPEDELIRGYSHQQAANKILQEGKAAKKQAEMLLSMLKDPQKFWEVAKKIGHDDRKMAEELLAGHLKKEMMDPRDRELEETRAKLKEIEDMQAKEKEAIKQKQFNEMKQKFSAQFNDQFVEALKTTAVPPTKETVAKMASYISRSAKLGVELTVKEAALMVEEDFRTLYARVAAQADGETLLKMFGDEVAQKILTARGAKVRSPEALLQTPVEQGQRRGAPKRASTKEQRRYLRGY